MADNLVEVAGQQFDESFIFATLTEAAINLNDALIAEIPKQSGKLAGTVKVIPAHREGDFIVAGCSVGDSQHRYAMDVWKGTPDDNYVRVGNPMMHFPSEKWPQFNPGRSLAGLGIDGWFHFRVVFHRILRKNDFVGRALDKVSKLIPDIAAKQFILFNTKSQTNG